MQQSKFSFRLTPSNPRTQLGFEVWINDQCTFATDHVAESVTISGDLPPDDVGGQHTLKFVLKNKQCNHTTVDDQGNIVADAVLEITDLAFDDIALGQIVNQLSVYHHDFNGTQAPTTDKFFDVMGCNGTVELPFTTPVYLWFLENM